MLFPIGDDDRLLPGPAFITIGLILANLIVFFFFQQAGANEVFTYGWSVIPAEITSGIDLVGVHSAVLGGERVQIPQAPGPSPIYLTLFSAMFMHGGWFHLLGNLVYLWIFGDNVEHRFGSLTFLSFYLISGLVATITQIALDPASIIPNLGASGAISGVLGAYMVLFPRNRVHAIVFFFIVTIPAVIAIGLWIVFQFVNGYGALFFASEMTDGIAYGAHIGGFFAGVVMALVLRMVIRKEPEHIFSKVPPTYKPWRYR